jgi:hypothetical protein
MARAAAKTPARTLMREIVRSTLAMVLAIIFPQIMLLLIWKNPLVHWPWIFSIANETHRFFELLAALVPLTVLEAVIGLFFASEFDRQRSKLSPQFTVCLIMPVVTLHVLSVLFVALALNYKEETLNGAEFFLICGLVVLSMALLLVVDGFMAAAKAELNHHRPRKRRALMDTE